MASSTLRRILGYRKGIFLNVTHQSIPLYDIAAAGVSNGLVLGTAVLVFMEILITVTQTLKLICVYSGKSLSHLRITLWRFRQATHRSI